MTISFAAFKNNVTGCPFTYNLTLSDGTAYDTSIITYITSSTSIGVNTSDIAKIGTYSLSLKATTTVY
jgi:hypothetical protein